MAAASFRNVQNEPVPIVSATAFIIFSRSVDDRLM